MRRASRRFHPRWRAASPSPSSRRPPLRARTPLPRQRRPWRLHPDPLPGPAATTRYIGTSPPQANRGNAILIGDHSPPHSPLAAERCRRGGGRDRNRGLGQPRQAGAPPEDGRAALACRTRRRRGGSPPASGFRAQPCSVALIPPNPLPYPVKANGLLTIGLFHVYSVRLERTAILLDP